MLNWEIQINSRCQSHYLGQFWCKNDICPASPSNSHRSAKSPTSCLRWRTYSTNWPRGQDSPGPDLQKGNGMIRSLILTRTYGSSCFEEQDNRSMVILAPIGRMGEMRHTRFVAIWVGRSFLSPVKIPSAVRNGAISPSCTLGINLAKMYLTQDEWWAGLTNSRTCFPLSVHREAVQLSHSTKAIPSHQRMGCLVLHGNKATSLEHTRSYTSPAQ